MPGVLIITASGKVDLTHAVLRYNRDEKNSFTHENPWHSVFDRIKPFGRYTLCQFDSVSHGVIACLTKPDLENPMSEARKDALRVNLDNKLKLEFHRARIASDTGSLAYRELDRALELMA